MRETIGTSGERTDGRAPTMVEEAAGRMHLGSVFAVDGSIVGCDSRFLATTGYSRPEVMAKRVTRLVAPETRDRLAAQLNRTESRSAVSVGIVTADGQVVPALAVSGGTVYRGELARMTMFFDPGSAREATGPIITALMGSVHALSRAIETRDPYTAGHQARVGEIAVSIATEMGFHREQLDHIQLGAMVHDIGKISIPTEILVKPARLMPWEWDMIRAHTEIGASIVAEIDCPDIVKAIVRSHHERLDGSGYPDGLDADELAHEVRVVAVADALDAITGIRPYHGRRTMEQAIDMLQAANGQYDPDAVGAAHSLIRAGKLHAFEEVPQGIMPG